MMSITLNFHSSLGSGPVTILVGTGREQKEFYIHESLLRTDSDFFARALREEEHRGVVNLPNVTAETFSIYAKWLYTGRAFLLNSTDDEDEGDDIEKRRLQNCYVLANFLQDLDFKDATIDVVIENIVDTKVSQQDLAQWIYPNSSEGSPHRTLAVDTFVNVWPRDTWPECKYSLGENVPPQFLFDVLANIGPNLENGIANVASPAEFFKNLDTCKYHEHTRVNQPCYKIKPTFRF